MAIKILNITDAPNVKDSLFTRPTEIDDETFGVKVVKKRHKNPNKGRIYSTGLPAKIRKIVNDMLAEAHKAGKYPKKLSFDFEQLQNELKCKDTSLWRAFARAGYIAKKEYNGALIVYLEEEE